MWSSFNIFFNNDPILVDADSLFNVIENHTDLVNPDIYTQVLVFYGRTENVPLCRTNIAKSICGYPQFVLDVLFIHGPVSGREENCQVNRGYIYVYVMLIY